MKDQQRSDMGDEQNEVRVTDRRRVYLDQEAAEQADAETETPNLKPSYVEELEARTKAEASLQEAERRFRDMLAGIELVAVILDTQGRVVFFNDFLVRLTDWRHDEVFGVNWFDKFVPAEYPGPGLVFARAIEHQALAASLKVVAIRADLGATS